VVCIIDVSKTCFHLKYRFEATAVRISDTLEIQPFRGGTVSTKLDYEILKITDATAPLLSSALAALRRLFITAVPNAEYRSIPQAIVVYFKEAPLNSSPTSEIPTKHELLSG
jgi:hypothetical protein